MSPEVDFPLKGPATSVTGEGFEPGVFATVGDQIAGLTEGFATLLTFVRFLS